MKTKFGAIIVDGRGKIGGHVASKNKAGSYLRTKVTPSNPRTASQTGVRALFTSIAQKWSTLSQEQRAAWNAAVEEYKKTDIFGDIKNPSGFNLFMKLNANIYPFTGVIFEDLPVKETNGNTVFTGINIQIALGAFVYAYQGDDPSALQIALSSSGALSDGTASPGSKLRVIQNQAFVSGDTTAYDNYVAKFGVPVVGQNIFLGIAIVSTSGLKSTVQIVKAKVVA